VLTAPPRQTFHATLRTASDYVPGVRAARFQDAEGTRVVEEGPHVVRLRGVSVHGTGTATGNSPKRRARGEYYA